MLVDLLKYSEALSQKAGVPMLLLAEPYSNLPDMDSGFHGKLLKGFDYQLLFNSLQEFLLPGRLVFWKAFGFLNYAVFAFPEKLRKEYASDYCMIGPVVLQPLSAADYHMSLESYHLSPEFYQDIQEFFNQIRMVQAPELWFQGISQFVSTLLDEPVETVHTEVNMSGFLRFTESEYAIPSNPYIAPNIVQRRYEAEDRFLKALLAGDTESLFPLYRAYRQYRLMPRSSDPLRNCKLQLTALNTLFRKTVQEACVHPLHIDNLSTQMAIQIENGEDLRQLELLELTMVRKYSMLVKKYSRKEHSALVQDCLDYIDFHYSSKLTLSNLAARAYVTTNYLSGLFKKETGMTITEYIQNTRIRQAQILLDTTTLPIYEIAAQCGYPDLNYFTRIFKKIQGSTPREYRAMIHMGPLRNDAKTDKTGSGTDIIR